jgi:hypothetical protein
MEATNTLEKETPLLAQASKRLVWEEEMSAEGPSRYTVAEAFLRLL